MLNRTYQIAKMIAMVVTFALVSSPVAQASAAALRSGLGI